MNVHLWVWDKQISSSLFDVVHNGNSLIIRVANVLKKLFYKTFSMTYKLILFDNKINSSPMPTIRLVDYFRIVATTYPELKPPVRCGKSKFIFAKDLNVRI